MEKFNIIELTNENEEQYLEQIEKLEQIVLKSMEENGQIGQLFATGKEDISEYVHSRENTVLVAADEENNIHAVAYITQGQQAFTYNDITKYFKYGNKYQEYVKSLYANQQEYQIDLLKTYEIKIKAYAHAKDKVLKKFPEYKSDIRAFLNHEIDEEGNHFHEKSQLRELLNTYMSEYINEYSNSAPEIKDKYNKFYWITSNEIEKEFGRKINLQSDNFKECETLIKSEEEEYRDILRNGNLTIHEEPTFDQSKYYSATTDNAIELDTYITNPSNRHSGLARILVYNGLKKHMSEHFKNEEHNEIFLCSTLHRDNFSSKYVSEFFGLKDSLYVKRRDGRDREVHICKIEKSEAEQYLDYMQKKLAVLYKYNPNNVVIEDEEKKRIIEEQLQYEKSEFGRIEGIRKKTKETKAKKYSGYLKHSKNKASKIRSLESMLHELENSKNEHSEENNKKNNNINDKEER